MSSNWIINTPLSADSSDRPFDLEQALGDALDIANPMSYAQVLAADERGELCPEGEALLDRWNFNAEFVPRRLGGRWDSTEVLIRQLRAVFRRDAALGLGYGVTSLMAAVNVWTGGSQAQQHDLSRLLLAGCKVSVAYHELEHGNDFLRNEVHAYPNDDGSLNLNGSKQVINNAHRAAAWAIFARTDAKPGARSHSILLLKKDTVESNRLQVLKRHRTAGVRGCHLSGLRFIQCPVSPEQMIGAPGMGAEIALRSFQVTRIVLPGMAIGMLDTALRTVVNFAKQRSLYGATLITLPHAREVLSMSMIDLLIADCMVRAVARSLHLFPEHASVYAAAVKYLVPSMLQESMNELSVILGARAYLRKGKYAVFGKLLRDLPVVSLGHAGGTVCLLTIMSQLPMLARRAAQRAPGESVLFDERMPLPPLDFNALTIVARGGDRLLDTLPNGLDMLVATGEGATPLAELVRNLSEELDALRADASMLPPSETGPAAQTASFVLAQRYAKLAAAAACFGIWQAHRTRADSPFLGGSAWITAALTRLSLRLGRSEKPLPCELHEEIVTEITRRAESKLSFCLYATQLSGDLDV